MKKRQHIKQIGSMKAFLFWGTFLSFFLMIESCKNSSKPTDMGLEFNGYETMYKDSFNILIHRRGDDLNLVDTLYTEMYIATKSCIEDSSSCDIVIDRVNKLIKMDTIKENQRRYLEAQMMAYSIKKDIDNFLKAQYKYMNTYPQNSIERLSGLVGYFLTVHEQDSANYYFSKVISYPDDFDDANKRLFTTICKIQSFLLFNKDEEAQDYLRERINKEQDEESKELFTSILLNFDDFKKEIMRHAIK